MVLDGMKPGRHNTQPRRQRKRFSLQGWLAGLMLAGSRLEYNLPQASLTPGEEDSTAVGLGVVEFPK